MARGVAIKNNLAATQVGITGLSVFGWAILGDETVANLIDYDSGFQVAFDASAGEIRAANASPIDLDLVAFINHNWPITAAVTITLYETIAFGGASEIVVVGANPAGDFRTDYNDYFKFVITDATINAQGGPKSIKIAVTGAGTTPLLGQLFLGNTTIPPFASPNFKVNYSYGYGQTLVSNEVVNTTIAGQTHGYRLNEQWLWSGLAWSNSDETTWRQLLNILSGTGAILPVLWIPDLDIPDSYYVQKISGGVPAAVQIINGIYTVGPFDLLEQARGIV